MVLRLLTAADGDDVGSAELNGVAEKLRRPRVTPSTIGRHLAALRRWMAYELHYASRMHGFDPSFWAQEHQRRVDELYEQLRQGLPQELAFEAKQAEHNRLES